tara:strand:+ start:20776 stop:20982 length:207 start_codon:yes stop_codon:yes gene_type:complete
MIMIDSKNGQRFAKAMRDWVVAQKLDDAPSPSQGRFLEQARAKIELDSATMALGKELIDQGHADAEDY